MLRARAGSAAPHWSRPHALSLPFYSFSPDNASGQLHQVQFPTHRAPPPRASTPALRGTVRRGTVRRGTVRRSNHGMSSCTPAICVIDSELVVAKEVGDAAAHQTKRGLQSINLIEDPVQLSHGQFRERGRPRLAGLGWAGAPDLRWMIKRPAARCDHMIRD